MKQFTSSYFDLRKRFQSDKIFVDSDIEDNLKEFLETQFYVFQGNSPKKINSEQRKPGSQAVTNTTPSSA
jgi:hypothetical protein